MDKYNHKEIEAKWQDKWEKDQVYQASNNSKKPKKYILIEFPYPSGEGLHMGHLRPYTAGDVYSRYFRMKGFETLYPIGWDAFGLPAENFAIKHKVHPSVSTAKNIANAKQQLQSWGMSFDWSREVNTTDPDYYKWTQWIFLQFYKAGLAYEATGLINWCPRDKTGLANEEVIDGCCERCGTAVEKKELRQWYLKITAYAEKLLQGLSVKGGSASGGKSLEEWPEPVKLQQENWIGKSEGAEIEFELSDSGETTNFIILHGRNGSPDSHAFPWLRAQLEKKGYKVQVPMLPNTQEPDDEEQTDFVLKNLEINEHTVIIGHSFGGVVALRLLEKGVKVKKVFLVCTPFSGKFLDNKKRPSVAKACEKGFDFGRIKKGAKGFGLIYDLTDYVVPMSDGEVFAKKLGVPLVKITGQDPHLSGKEEPEVLTTILPSIRVFTTRPDTLFGATYMVLAPEHPLIANIKYQISNIKEVEQYIEAAKKKTDIQRAALEKDLPAGKAGKTGVELKGIKAINPATKEEIPVWVADYVLMGYGTGAIMAVPAHDERDFEFAKKYNLSVRRVVQDPLLFSRLSAASEVGNFLKGGETRMFEGSGSPPFKEGLGEVFTGSGKLVNSGKFDDLDSEKAKWEITKFVGGQKKTQYKLRDWVFSRQRYWGEPIPLIHCEKCGTVSVPEDELPVTLPEVENYEPTGTGESPLAVIDLWVNIECPKCGGKAKRETNTMPQWAGSSWYWLRYTDPKNDEEIASKKLLKRWTPVDVYFGGMEHTTLHLLYARFWNLFLYDQGFATAKEPFIRRVPHGIVLASDGEKMSKSRGNVVNPDDIVAKFGADCLRMYEMFLGPHGDTVSWNDKGIMGVKRFLDKVWRVGFLPSPFEERDSLPRSLPRAGRGEVNNAIHRLIKKISEDIEQFKFNTAISAFMEFLNKHEQMSKLDWEIFLRLLAPFAPHITEELWEQLGHQTSIHLEQWPEHNPRFIIEEVVNVVIQVNGNLRATLTVNSPAIQTDVSQKAQELPNVKKYLEGKQVTKEIFVPDKLINFVVK